MNIYHLYYKLLIFWHAFCFNHYIQQEGVMSKQDLLKKLSGLEFANDQMKAELVYVDQLMRQVGFTEGLKSLKETAKELYENIHEGDEQIA